jgi:hypothetical protein
MTAQVPQDWLDLIACLREEGCEFVVVGAHALAAHGLPRATGDLDLLVQTTRTNAERAYRALVRFGPPVQAHGLTADDFAMPGTVYQLGLPPFRIDVLTELAGVDYAEVDADVIEGRLGTEPVRFIGIEPMLRNKRAAGRPQDLADAAALEELRARSR